MKMDLKTEIEVPENTTISIENNMVKVQGPKGTVERRLVHPKMKISMADNKVVIESKKASKREKTVMGTFKAHIKNMFHGVNEGHVYKLKICFSHFPMNVTVNNNQLVIKNFLGESHPRIVNIKQGVDVKVEGGEITVESPDIELAGQTATEIEKSTRITNRDRRIFQDGIYITNKRGKRV